MNLSLPIMLALVAFVLTVVPADSTGSQDSTESQDSTGSQKLKELRAQKLKCQEDILKQDELVEAAEKKQIDLFKSAQEDEKHAEHYNTLYEARDIGVQLYVKLSKERAQSALDRMAEVEENKPKIEMIRQFLKRAPPSVGELVDFPYARDNYDRPATTSCL
eukprot:GHVS01108299.1.p1 GENE.GHVS01108299.1~~GHVS01108299.1.p1  ORF type:complete len:162 (+),score=16.26 GHVS01108299.1:298-783(+)